jgi:hypothetical protein
MCKRTCLKRRQVKALKEAVFDEYMVGKMSLSDMTLEAKMIDGLLGEAHHVYAKFHYPERAYDLDNGITLCWRCHRQVVHSTYETFRLYLHMFKCYMRRKLTKAFNTKYQSKMKPK